MLTVYPCDLPGVWSVPDPEVVAASRDMEKRLESLRQALVFWRALEEFQRENMGCLFHRNEP